MTSPTERRSFLLDRPAVALTILGVLIAVLAWQARSFEINASADLLLSEDNRHYIHTQVVNQRYSPQEFLLVAYRPRDRQPLSPAVLAELEALSARLSQLERVSSVRSVRDVPLFSAAKTGLDGRADPAELSIARQDYSQEDIADALRGHPLYEDLLINREQTALALQVLFNPLPELANLESQIVELRAQRLNGELTAAQRTRLESLERQAAPLHKRLDRQRYREIGRIRAIIAEFEDGADIFLGGAHVLSFQLVEIIRNDLVIFGSAIAGLIVVLLSLLFRNWRWVVIPVTGCAASVLATMGVFALLGFEATVISSNFISLQLILTLAITIHLIVQYRELHRLEPEAGNRQLLRQVLSRKARPCLYAGLTTSVGFASLWVSGIRPVMDFGIMMTVAMAISLLLSLSLFPAMMALFGAEPATPEPRYSQWLLRRMLTVVQRHRRAVALLSLGLLGASVTGLLRLDVENSFINYFRESTQVHRELKFIDRQFGGTTALDLTYRIPPAQVQEDLVVTAALVQDMQRVQQLLENQPGMGKILSLVNFTELARRLNDDRPVTEYELTALYRTLDTELREQLLGGFFDPQLGELRMAARIQDSTPGLNRAALLADIREGLSRLGIDTARYRLTNSFVLFQDLLARLFRSQILTLALVYVLLGLAFLLVFRSPSLALIGLAPNVLSTLAILGLMGWTGIALDFMTITIAAIAMGIAVDDTIHYIHRFREERMDLSPGDAVERTQAGIGSAILYTSVIVALGFALLGFSDFVPSVLFGLLTAVAMMPAMLTNLMLMPLLLSRGDTAATVA